MKISTVISTFAVAVTLGFTFPASAQVSNAPYSPGARSLAAGISLGYRQAILNAKILGQRPKALVRGPSGQLVDVQRSGRNAFVLSPGDGSYVPGARPNAGWPTGLGTGLGWGLASYSNGGTGVYVATPARSLNAWIVLVPAGPDGGTSNFSVYSDGGSPIDTWISQLDLI